MKNTVVYLLLFCSFSAAGQNNYSDSIRNERVGKESHLLNSKAGILNEDDLIHFKGLNHFEVDTLFNIKAKFIKDIGKRFKMPTSTERQPIYRRYGYLYFEINQVACTLTVYQNMALRKMKEHKNSFFIPFRDETSAIESYGGGRYLDIQILKGETSKQIDFNLSYNPYCAYSHRYSCPIPPNENTLPVSIRAGEMTPISVDE